MNKEEAQFQKQLEQLDALVKQKMTRDALQRYGNIKAAHPKKAFQLLMLVAQLSQKSEIGMIDDEKLKSWLVMLTPKKQFNIKRK